MIIIQLFLLFLPLLTLAQNSNSSQQSQSAPSSSSRQETTVVLSRVISTVVPVPTESNGNGTSASSTTPTVSLPPKSTAPTVDGGGYNGGSGAPVPGAKSPNNAFGPDDNYIAAATALARSAFTVTLVACLIASAVLVV
ncbi:hypothetical protein BJ165DRAFT_1398921 [Panaeolus papilionaceus]|nr:hypothetical protein BJ165DRAFT_1398921 [Panaeolus papilionaceus]